MYSFTAERINDRRPSPEKLEAQLQKMAKAALRGNRGTVQGWYLVNKIVAPHPVSVGASYKYTFTFQFDRRTQRSVAKEVSDKQFEVLMDMAQQAGNLHKWTISQFSTDEVKPAPVLAKTAILPVPVQATPHVPVKMTPVNFNENGSYNLNPEGFFDHLYDREEQINVILSDVRTAVESDFKIRNHTLVEGDPAGGKTTLCKAFIDMIGEDYCHYIDATTSTQAGILLELMEVPDEIRFVIIEEIEKVKPDDLRWLLGVMDERGMINVCNAKVGLMRRHLPVYIIATVNDVYKFESFQSGSLASRFGNRVYCPRINEDTMFKAVKQAVDKVNGDPAWIKPAIEYCLNEEKTSDIRRIKTVALAGRERLLTGEYQKILKATSRPR